MATKTFLNVTDSTETFSKEFERMSGNLDQIHNRLTAAISDVMDPAMVSDNDKLRYQDMVEQMTKSVMKPVNRKIAFLTFKIVEETIKRRCLKCQIERVLPVESETLKLIRKNIGEATIKFHSGSREGDQPSTLSAGASVSPIANQAPSVNFKQVSVED